MQVDGQHDDAEGRQFQQVISAPKKRTSMSAVKQIAAVLINVRVIAPNLLRMMEMDKP